MKGYQQGDCILIQRSALPGGVNAVKPSAGRLILAEGEHTGHAHAIEATPEVELYEVNGTLWLKVVGEARLTHEEHHAQTVAPGVYEIRRVVEVDPFADEVRTVAD